MHRVGREARRYGLAVLATLVALFFCGRRLRHCSESEIPTTQSGWLSFFRLGIVPLVRQLSVRC